MEPFIKPIEGVIRRIATGAYSYFDLWAALMLVLFLLSLGYLVWIIVSNLLRESWKRKWPRSLILILIAVILASLFLFLYFAKQHPPYEFKDVVWLAERNPSAFVVRAIAIRASDGKPGTGQPVKIRVLRRGEGNKVLASIADHMGKNGFLQKELKLKRPVSDRRKLSLQFVYRIYGLTYTANFRFPPVIFKFDTNLANKEIREGKKTSFSGTVVSGRYLPKGSNVWVLLRDDNDNYYLQHPRVYVYGGRWHARKVIAGAGIRSGNLVWVDSSGDKHLNKRVRDENWKGFQQLPKNSVLLATTQLRVVTSRKEKNKTPSSKTPPAPPSPPATITPPPPITPTPSPPSPLNEWQPPAKMPDDGEVVTDKTELWSIAREYGYDNAGGKYAPVLTDGDINYWAERRLTTGEIRIKFKSRGDVIKLAEERGYRIKSPEDISNLAEDLQSSRDLQRIEERLRNEDQP